MNPDYSMRVIIKGLLCPQTVRQRMWTLYFGKMCMLYML